MESTLDATMITYEISRANADRWFSDGSPSGIAYRVDTLRRAANAARNTGRRGYHVASPDGVILASGIVEE